MNEFERVKTAQQIRNLEDFATCLPLDMLKRWNSLLEQPNSLITKDFLAHLISCHFEADCLAQVLLAAEHGVSTPRLSRITMPEFSASVIEQLRLACENGLSDDEIYSMIRSAYDYTKDSSALVALREGYEKAHQVEKLVNKGKKILDV